MALSHGVYFKEETTSVQTPTEITSGLVVAVGTAPKSSSKPILAYTLSEATAALGYDTDFEKYTLCEVMRVHYGLYNVVPAVFINVYNPEKHNTELSLEVTGESSFSLAGEVLTDTVTVKTGGIIETPELQKDTDYEVFEDEIFGDEDDASTEVVIFRLKKEGGTVNISYRTAATALGGEEIETEVTLSRMEQFYLPSDTVLESVVVTSGEDVDTTADLDFELEVGDTATVVTILSPNLIQENKVKVSYKIAAPENVSDDDIITALDQIDSIYGRWNLNAGLIIAPKFSTKRAIAAAMARKAQTLDAMAIADITAPTYQDAVEVKTTSNLSNSHLIICYPKVSLDGTEYFLSTHLASLMNVVDADNEGIPYQSPSNNVLQIDSAVIDGAEIFLTQEQGNLLNAAGIVTVRSFNGWRAWGNLTSAYPGTTDVKDIFISTRRMLNYLKNYIASNFISNLDVPITKRAIDGMLLGVNVWLASLAARSYLLGAEAEFNSNENSVTDLLAGRITLAIRYAAPTPAQEIHVNFEYDVTYFETLF